MTRKILCDPDDKKGRPIYGKLFKVCIRVEDSDGTYEDFCGEYELCDAHAKPFNPAIEFVRAMELAGQVPDAPKEPVKRIGPPKDAPATPDIPDSWRCGLCDDDAVYIGQQRTGHMRVHHSDKRIWEIPWIPLFDTAGWYWCTCGYPTKTVSGMRQHHQMSGHTGVRDSELTTETARALNRAAESRQ